MRTFTRLPTSDAAPATQTSKPSSLPTAAVPSWRSTSTSSTCSSAPSATGAFGARSGSLPSASTTKWSRCVSGLPSRKKRRFVIDSSSRKRAAPGPINAAAIGAASSTRYACEREPATSERNRRSTSIAADASE